MKPKPAKRQTWAGLARTLHISRPTVASWRRLPDAPQTPAPGPWRAFVAANELGLGHRLSPRRRALLESRLEKQNTLLGLEVARRETRVVDRSAMEALNESIRTKQRRVLLAALGRDYPALVVGKTAGEIRVIGQQMADQLCAVFSQDVEEWAWPPRRRGR